MATLYRRFINEMYIHGYSLSEEAPTFRVPENFDKYRRGPGWQAYQGANDWESGTTGVAIYLNPEGYNKEMARIWFEVKYPDHLDPLVGEAMSTNRPEYREIQKWGRKGSVRWIREAERIRKSTRKFHGVHDGYAREWVERKPWKECFIMALQSDRMKPFVKEYGVDHTKWVGMKRCELNESGIPSKFWWMDPDGELIPVPKFGYAGVGKSILKKEFGVETENTFTELQSRGYIRVGFAGLWNQYFLEINHNRDKSPNATQWRALKDLAIEMGADSIDDNTTGLKVRVDESRLLFENFHENKEWFVYEGTNTVTTVFEDNSRQTFKLHFHDKRLSEDRDKIRKKAANTWKRLAKEVRDSAGLNRAGNPVIIPWQECFQKALKHPEMLEFIDDLRATPIFEAYGWFPMYNLWLSPEGKPYKGGSHESIGSTYLRAIGKEVTGTRAVYDTMYGMGFVRVVVGDNMYPLIVDSGRPGRPKLSGEQREWIEDKSFELGLNGEYSSADGRNFVAEGINEMTYDDLRNSMKNYRSKSDMRKGTTTGSDSRERGAKDVRAKSLRVISTIGKDGNEHETSLFSYKSFPTGRDPKVHATHPRWKGYIRFIGDKPGESEVAPVKEKQDVEVNCTCPDYKYVWAKANADAGAGETGQHTAKGFSAAGPVTSVEPKPMQYYAQTGGKKPVNIFEAEEEQQAVDIDRRWRFQGGNTNDGTRGKRIRNPNNTPGLCKHLIAVAEYIEGKLPQVAPAEPGKEEPDQVAPKQSKLKKRGKPINIFEQIKQFALANPTFDVPYED